MARTWRRRCDSSAVTARLVAVHQSAGFCSDQPECGRETVSGAVAWPATVPLSSTRTALTLEVPMSMPRNIAHQSCGQSQAAPRTPLESPCRARTIGVSMASEKA